MNNQTTRSTCKYCGSTKLDTEPTERWSWNIPFTKIEVKVWDWSTKREECNNCYVERLQPEPDTDWGRL